MGGWVGGWAGGQRVEKQGLASWMVEGTGLVGSLPPPQFLLSTHPPIHPTTVCSKHNAMAIPPQFKDLIEVDVNTLTYAPHVWFNDFWLLRDYLVGGWWPGWVERGYI